MTETRVWSFLLLKEFLPLIAIGVASFLVLILFKKLRPRPASHSLRSIKKIQIKTFDEKGCRGQDDCMIPWGDINAVLKEEKHFVPIAEFIGWPIQGTIALSYRLVLSNEKSGVQYELACNFRMNNDQETLKQKAQFNVLAGSFLREVKRHPHIEFRSRGVVNLEKEERTSVDKEIEFLESCSGPDFIEKAKQSERQREKVFLIQSAIILSIAAAVVLLFWR